MNAVRGFLAALLVYQAMGGPVKSPPAFSKPVYSDSYLPAAMQVIFHAVDQLKLAQSDNAREAISSTTPISLSESDEKSKVSSTTVGATTGQANEEKEEDGGSADVEETTNRVENTTKALQPSDESTKGTSSQQELLATSPSYQELPQATSNDQKLLEASLGYQGLPQATLSSQEVGEATPDYQGLLPPDVVLLSHLELLESIASHHDLPGAILNHPAVPEASLSDEQPLETSSSHQEPTEVSSSHQEPPESISEPSEVNAETPELNYATPETNYETPELEHSAQETNEEVPEVNHELDSSSIVPEASTESIDVSGTSSSSGSIIRSEQKKKEPTIDSVVREVYEIVKPTPSGLADDVVGESKSAIGVSVEKLETLEDEDDENRFTRLGERVTQVPRPSLTSYLRRAKVPPSATLQQLANLYDSLSKDARKQGFGKYTGYSDEVLNTLETSAEGGVAPQLKTILEKVLERNELTREDAKTRTRQAVKDLDNPSSNLSRELRPLLPLRYSP
ncbi:ecdysone-inducible gene E3 [Halictus rubicundus]|uniref:ecdysone-inducible gene E3 n=1 Tax=Halictus rubicundus TaxID=77578 RepID=UPI0040351B53